MRVKFHIIVDNIDTIKEIEAKLAAMGWKDHTFENWASNILTWEAEKLYVDVDSGSIVVHSR